MKTMLRKASIVLLMMSLMTTTAFAGTMQATANANENVNMQVQLEKQADRISSIEEKILTIGDNSNLRITMEIEKALIKAESITDAEEMNVLIRNLLKKTEQISAVSIEKIDRLGGEAICELIEVEIGGQVIWVDPIRIVRLR